MRLTKEVEERILAEARFIVTTNSTIRETANHFKRAKTSVHIDVTRKLLQLKQRTLYNNVQEVLTFNKKYGHFKGGYATARKYKTKDLK